MAEIHPYDFSLWRAQMTMDAFSGVTVKIINPKGRVVAVQVFNAESMWRLRDLEPDASPSFEVDSESFTED